MPYRVCVRLQRKLTLLKVRGDADIPGSALAGRATNDVQATERQGAGPRQAAANQSVRMWCLNGSRKAGPLGWRPSALHQQKHEA